MANLNVLPEGLPVPVDDGACNHLVGKSLPQIDLPSTSGRRVELFALPRRTVIYCYPLTGRPDRSLPAGWNEIPGARGCTPQACAFRDHFQELHKLGVDVYGLSAQTTEYQQEALARLHLPYELLSDTDLKFTRTLELPTFEVDEMILIKRLTMVVTGGVIEKVFYPVFPPDKSAEEVIAWLKQQ